MTRRIGFLFNHDQTHQIAHSLPIALELIASGAADVTLMTSNAHVTRAIKALAGDAITRATLIELHPKSPVTRAVVHFLDRWVPAAKLAIYRDHLDLFGSFDALIVPEKSSLLLKSRYRLDQLKMVHTRHGAGDRAIGFNAESAGFDLILVAGDKIRDRLMTDAGVPPEKIAITGYCKFDMFGLDKPDLPLLRNGKPTVLYNPHPSPKLSSWFRWGPQILEQFAAQDRYNLIFAPHIMLFARGWTISIDPPAIARNRPPAPHIMQAPHILTDLGSDASSDMTYTRAADLYLGDVSSQIYEFLAKPRPCLFLNAHDTAWQNDPSYKHWRAAPVLTSADHIIDAVDAAFASFPDYLQVQQSLLAETFSVTDQPAARRGAEAILTMLSTAS